MHGLVDVGVEVGSFIGVVCGHRLELGRDNIDTLSGELPKGIVRGIVRVPHHGAEPNHAMQALEHAPPGVERMLAVAVAANFVL